MVLLQCLEALCQYSDQVVVHHKAVLAHLLPALAAAVGRQGESRDSRFLCLKLLCDVILHFLLETDLYSAPSQQQQSQANHAGKHINDTKTLVQLNSKGYASSIHLQSQGTHSGKHVMKRKQQHAAKEANNSMQGLQYTNSHRGSARAAQ